MKADSPTDYFKPSQRYEMLDRKTNVSVDEVYPSRVHTPGPSQAQSVAGPWEPKLLAQDKRWRVIWNMYDTFLGIISFALLVKTSLCVYASVLDRDNSGYRIDSVSSLTTFLIEFNDQLVTAFTILFVTIISTATHRYALYRAQQGECLIDVEQLHASVSLPSTIAMVFSLRKFTRFSAILVAVWSFYYLGSQAAKREYALHTSAPFTTIHAAYPSDKIGTYLDQEGSQDGRFEALLEPANSFIRAANLANAYSGMQKTMAGVDMLGRMVVPDLELEDFLLRPMVADFERSNGFQDWLDVKGSKTLYTAVIGRPLLTQKCKMDNDTKTRQCWWSENGVVGKYQFKTSSFSVGCKLPEILRYEEFPLGLISDGVMSINTSVAQSSVPQSSSNVAEFDFWTRWNDTYGGSNYEENEGPVSGSTRTHCNVTNVKVELQAHCVETGCLVKRIRRVVVDPSVLHETPFSDEHWASLFFNNILLSSSSPTTGILGLAYHTVTGFIEDPSSLQDFSVDRILGWYLGQALNSYYNVILDVTDYAEETPDDQKYTLFDFEGGLYEPQYRLNWYWIAIDYVSGLLLLLGSLFSFWLRRRTLAPDIFGCVSSLTRQIPSCPELEGGSALSGLERTRHLRNVKIKIADIGQNDENVGKIGLAIVGGTQSVEELRSDRKYM